MVQCEKSIPLLFESPASCCGCGACAAACPSRAISMVEHADGFVLPQIDEDACIRCGLCKRVCGFQKAMALGGVELNGMKTRACYAAAARGGEPLSASGGVFTALARSVLERGGVVYGAAYERVCSELRVRHRRVDNVSGLAALQGSKYVQSDAACCFADVQRDVRAGRAVLFSGTPCQVAGLKGFLRKDYPNLLTADLVCHGVPSEAMFRGYVSFLERWYGAPVTDMRFRCKRDGWGDSLKLLVDFGVHRGECAAGDGTFYSYDYAASTSGVSTSARSILIPAGLSSYYDLFLSLHTLRDSCYACPFAGLHRSGDITLGDFWGVERRRPDLLRESGGPFDTGIGVSCLLANSERGAACLAEYGSHLVMREVPLDDIVVGNEQLRAPARLPSDREDYLKAFARDGWQAVNAIWRRRNAAKILKQRITSAIPVGIKRSIKKNLSRLFSKR